MAKHAIDDMRYRRNKTWWVWRLRGRWYREFYCGDIVPLT